MACSESGLRTQEQGLEGRGRVMGSYSLLILTPHRPQLWTTTTDFFPNPPLPSTIFFTPQVLSPSPRHPLSLSNFFFSFSFLIKITDLILLFYSQHLLFEMEWFEFNYSFMVFFIMCSVWTSEQHPSTQRGKQSYLKILIYSHWLIPNFPKQR